MKYNGATYVYRKDAQGNVIALIDETGKELQILQYVKVLHYLKQVGNLHLLLKKLLQWYLLPVF